MQMNEIQYHYWQKCSNGVLSPNLTDSYDNEIYSSLIWSNLSTKYSFIWFLNINFGIIMWNMSPILPHLKNLFNKKTTSDETWVTSNWISSSRFLQ